MVQIEASIDITAEYMYGLSLFTGGMVNLVLAGLLVFDRNNFIYQETPRYLRSRYITALSLAIFGIGFLVHWIFVPRYLYPLSASAFALIHYHAGGTCFSMSHTGLIDRHYLKRRVVIRDVSILFTALSLYVTCVILQSKTLLYIGYGVFFVHVLFMIWKFWLSFHRVYTQLGNYANWYSNDTDHEIQWLFYSCYVIIFFGLFGVLVDSLFPNSLWPYTTLMFISNIAFAYIYKAMDNFSLIVTEVEKNLEDSEEFLTTEHGQAEMRVFIKNKKKHSWLSVLPFLSGFFKQD